LLAFAAVKLRFALLDVHDARVFSPTRLQLAVDLIVEPASSKSSGHAVGVGPKLRENHPFG
jgi:hypothetical protein